MKTTIIAFDKSDLASRRSAAVERKALEQALILGNIEVDLIKVNSISESYSDELFGVLVAKYGLQNFLQRVKISNAKNSILKSIATVVQRREMERKKQALVACA